MFTIKVSQPELWTIGHYDPKGTWYAHSDFDDKAAAEAQVSYLNGGAKPQA